MSDENSQIAEEEMNQPEVDVVAEGDVEGEQKPEDLHLLLEDARTKADEHWDQVLRLQAELENVRRRAAKDVESAHKFGLEKFVKELLPIIDSLQMGLEASQNSDDEALHKLQEGTEMTINMFINGMARFNVQAVGKIGDKFNPEFHQAMTMQESNEHDPDTVMMVMQKGYVMNGRLIRPAMVMVSKAPADKPDSSSIDLKA
ncbi:MAG TPA: nucleotide exchange factor GrpE [Ectothiorhodospiraceae bacterium]|nr:nucleotide exchange factor GrpE [Ectothiorhodospiraceae bacterium]